MTLAGLLAFFVLALAAVVAKVLLSDRKRDFRRTGRIWLEKGSNAAARVVVRLSPDAAVAAAQAAIGAVGGREVRECADRTVVGWIGTAWSDVPGRAEHQLTVTQSPQPDGTLLVECHCQTRFWPTRFFGSGRCRELAAGLAAQFSQQAGLAPQP